MLAPSCKKYQPAPAAFHWRPSGVSVVPAAGQGSASHGISDYWLYVNGQFQGVYPVGATMPIVSHDHGVRLLVVPGIRNNGIGATRVWWPFYSSVQVDTSAAAGSTLTMPLQFSYKSVVNFAWLEDFDGGVGVSVAPSDLSDTTFRIIDGADAFENRSMELALAAPHTVAQVESTGEGFALPASESNVYLEINYKCNNEFSVGLIGDDLLPRPVIFLNPRNEWNKIYIQLAQAVNTPQTSSRYRVYFRMVRGESQENPRLFLDNIKLVYL